MWLSFFAYLRKVLVFVRIKTCLSNDKLLHMKVTEANHKKKTTLGLHIFIKYRGSAFLIILETDAKD